MSQVSAEHEMKSEERIAATQKVVLEAFASHGVVLSKDDPIVALGTVLEIALVRGTQEHSATFSLQMADLVKDIAALHAESRSELGNEAARFVEAIRSERETELDARRRPRSKMPGWSPPYALNLRRELRLIGRLKPKMPTLPDTGLSKRSSGRLRSVRRRSGSIS